MQLYVTAVKPEFIEAKVLPEYTLHKVAFDKNTYTHLSKLHLQTRDLDKVIAMFDQSQEKGLQPTWRLLSNFLEAGLRKNDPEIIIHALTKFVEQKLEPHPRALKLLGNIRHMPDEIYVILRKYFPRYGAVAQDLRQFEQPSFRP